MYTPRRNVWLTLCLFLLSLTGSSAAVPPGLFPQPASHITRTAATLHGTIVPNDFSNAVWFEWGTNGSFSQTTSPDYVTNGTGVVWLSSTITNLTPYSAYQYRLVASNSAGVSYGLQRLFVTGAKIATWNGNAHPSYLTNVVQIEGNNGYGMGLTTEGTVSIWGTNGDTSIEFDSPLTGITSIAAGWAHRLALKEDGTVLAWGGNAYLATNVPPGLTNVVAISAGFFFSAALKADGTLVTWGMTRNIGSVTNVVSIVGSGYDIMTLRPDGTVKIYGEDSGGGTNVPAGLNGVAAIAAGFGDYIALRTNGTVRAWGALAGAAAANIFPALDTAIEISGGADDELFALQANGKPWAWGKTADGRAIPPVPSYFSNVTAIAANTMVLGNIHPQAASQKVFSVANNDVVIALGGSDANGDPLSARVTALPAAGTLYQYVNQARGAPIFFTNTVVTDPQLRVIYAPPFNVFGKPFSSFNFVLNDGEVDSVPAAVTIYIDSTYAYTLPATQITETHAVLNGVALPNGIDCTAWFEWGKRGLFDHKTAAQPVGNGKTLTRISAAIDNLPGGTCQFKLVVSNAAVGIIRGPIQFFSPPGAITAWGRNFSGQTVVPDDLTNAISIACGLYYSVALKSDGTVEAWGDSSPASTNAPVGLSNVIAIASGETHGLALKSDGTVVAWGDSYNNSYGTLNVPPFLTNVVAIAGGQLHSLALKSDGTVISWGYNSDGQTNVPPGLSNVVAIAAGRNDSLALRIDGTVVAWGWSQYGQTNIPANLTNVIAVAGGLFDTIALKSDGTVRVWGDNTYNQTNLPPGLTNVIAISSRGAHSLALTAGGTVVAWGYDPYGQTDVPGDLCDAGQIAGGYYHSLAIGRIGNQVPEASAQTVSGIPNSDLIITLTGSDADGDVLSYHVVWPPSFGTLYQFSTGTRGAGVTNADTIVTDPKGRLVFAPDPDVTGKPYSQFDFIADDGVSKSSSQTVMINILTQPPTPSLVGWHPNSSPHLSMQGDPGAVYELWVSTNLINWEDLGTFQETSPGLFEFDDLTGTNHPARFYRSAIQ